MLLFLDVDISRLIIYYTDWHDVDEDLMNMARQGGFWGHNVLAGFCDRSMSSLMDTLDIIVVSRW